MQNRNDSGSPCFTTPQTNIWMFPLNEFEVMKCCHQNMAVLLSLIA